MAGIYDFIREEYDKAKKAFGLIGGIPKTFKNNPRNAETMDAIFGLGGIVPGVGDAVSAAEAKYRYDQGDMLGAGLAGVGALPLVPSIAGMFVGKGSKTWDVLKNAEAVKMEKAGVDPRKIWAETGNWKAPDGKWRQEIPDDKARIIENAEANSFMLDPGPAEYPLGPLNSFLDHKAVSAAYPDAMGVSARMKKGESGAYIPTTGFGEGFDLPSKNTKSTTLHELQHAIQQREGWARGGSPEGMRQEALEMLRRDVASGEIPTTEQAMAMLPMAQQNAYRRLAGEAEARATQARMNMDMAERLKTFPADSYDVPLDQLIVRYGDGPAMSTSRPVNHMETAEQIAEHFRKQGLIPKIDQAKGGSVYVTAEYPPARKNGKPRPFTDNPKGPVGSGRQVKIRVADHGEAYIGNSMSIDPHSGNTADTAIQYLDYILGKAERPKMGHSRIDVMEGRNYGDVTPSAITISSNALDNQDAGAVLRAVTGGTEPAQAGMLGGDALNVAQPRRPVNHLGQEIPPTQFELAHAEAQRVAALPVEQGGLGLPADNTAMDRARAMGFDVDVELYHGTGADFPAFSNAVAHRYADGSGGPQARAVWLTQGQGEANMYAGNELTVETGAGAPNVMPVSIRPGNTATVTDRYDVPNALSGADTVNVRQDLYSELAGEPQHWSVVKDPSRIRARFAAFNPANRDSADLLAGLAAPLTTTALLAALLAKPDEAQAK